MRVFAWSHCRDGKPTIAFGSSLRLGGRHRSYQYSPGSSLTRQVVTLRCQFHDRTKDTEWCLTVNTFSYWLPHTIFEPHVCPCG